jgi:hypothetical protein
MSGGIRAWNVQARIFLSNGETNVECQLEYVEGMESGRGEGVPSFEDVW